MADTNSSCKCCLEGGRLKRMWLEHCIDGEREVYGTMLAECFALKWKKPENPQTSTEQICELCITRLKDAISFKAEVLASEQLLSAQKDVVNHDKLKQEIGDVEEIQSNYLNYDYMGGFDHADNVDQIVDGNERFLNNIDGGDNIDKFDGHDDENEDEDALDVTIKLEQNPENQLPSAKPPKEPSSRCRRSAPTKKYKQYSTEDVQQALDAVIARKMSQTTAAKRFRVSKRALSKILKSKLKVKLDASDSQKTIENVPSDSSKVPLKILTEKKKKKQTYPEQDLFRAVEEVWHKRMTQTQAAKYYNVPRSTIFDMLIKNYGKPPKLDPNDEAVKNKKKSKDRSQEMAKHATNILTIMEHSNATPIRCHGDGGYMCCFCDHQYIRPGDLKTHTIQSHDIKTKRTFPKGKRPSSYFVKLDISFLQCTICGEKIGTLEDLVHHLIDVHGKKMFTDIKNHILPFKFESDELRCVVCGNVFNSFKVLQEHLNVHYQNYTCDVCNTGFVSKMILYNHSRGHNLGVFNCDQCPKVYNTQRKLRSHQSLVHRHNYMVSKCGYCNEKFKSYHRKVEHLTRVHNVRAMKFLCNACDRSFNTQAGLRIHRKRDHLLERKYKCPQCDMKFFAKAAVEFHMLKHSDAREFQCDVCKKSYKRKSTLREHMRIHENNRRFKCEFCDVSFIQKCSWRGHMRTKHGVIS